VIDLDSIICDCKTGVSGAGKKPSPTFHYPARYDHMNAYKLAGHQHVCEVERELGLLAGASRITFTAQVVPPAAASCPRLYGTCRRRPPKQVLEAYRSSPGQRLRAVYDRARARRHPTCAAPTTATWSSRGRAHPAACASSRTSTTWSRARPARAAEHEPAVRPAACPPPVDRLRQGDGAGIAGAVSTEKPEGPKWRFRESCAALECMNRCAVTR
jgi:hypothetical protein